MKTYTFFIALILSISVGFSQAWTTSYTGTGKGMDEIKSMVLDNVGNVYVTGYSWSGATENDYITIKYNTNGTKLWTARYNGTGNGSDIPNSIFADKAGNVYVTGKSNRVHNAIFDNDATTIKYSSLGVQLWVARYDGSLHREDAANAVKADDNGNVYVTGFTTVSNGAYSAADYLTIKYNAAGVQQWAATHNGPGNLGDAAVGLGLDAAGNIYVTGTDFAGRDPLGEGDYFTIKYNPSGVQQWGARFNGAISESDGATGIAVDNAGNSFVTGSSRLGGINTDFVTVKYNTNGVQQWVADYGGEAKQGDIPSAITIDKAGNVYVTGTDQKIPYNYDFRTLKYNSSGELQWSKRYNGPVSDNDGATAIAVDKTGNVYVTGFSIGITFDWDIATIKYSAAGAQKWVKRYNGSKDSADVGNAIAVDSSGNVYVAGASANKKSSWDFITLKYSEDPQTATQIVADNLQAGSPMFSSLKNYPNPFKNITTISFNVTSNVTTPVLLNIYDITGKKVTTLINNKLAAGTYSITWSASNFKPGIYLYKLSNNGYSVINKMIIAK